MSRSSRSRAFAVAAGAGRRSHPRAERVRAGFSQSARHGRGFRQGRAVAGRRCCELGFGFTEVGTLTPRPQAGQSPSRACSGCMRIADVDQPLRLQQSRATKRRAKTCCAGRAWRHRRRQYRRQQGCPPTAPPIMSRESRVSPTSPVISPSIFPRPTRPACATSSRRARSTTCWRASSSPRRGWRKTCRAARCC